MYELKGKGRGRNKQIRKYEKKTRKLKRFKTDPLRFFPSVYLVWVGAAFVQISSVVSYFETLGTRLRLERKRERGNIK